MHARCVTPVACRPPVIADGTPEALCLWHFSITMPVRRPRCTLPPPSRCTMPSCAAFQWLSRSCPSAQECERTWQRSSAGVHARLLSISMQSTMQPSAAWPHDIACRVLVAVGLWSSQGPACDPWPCAGYVTCSAALRLDRCRHSRLASLCQLRPALCALPSCVMPLCVAFLTCHVCPCLGPQGGDRDVACAPAREHAVHAGRHHAAAAAGARHRVLRSRCG